MDVRALVFGDGDIVSGWGSLKVDSDGEWLDLIDRTIAENRMLDGYLRIQISRGEGMSSIKWERRLLRRPEPNVTIIPIPGFKTVAQVEENARAMELGPLISAQMQEIDTILGR